jgi:hypothetical protein
MATEAASAGAGAAYEEERRKRILDNLKHLEVRDRSIPFSLSSPATNTNSDQSVKSLFLLFRFPLSFSFSRLSADARKTTHFLPSVSFFRQRFPSTNWVFLVNHITNFSAPFLLFRRIWA